jgi:hypothetical protein
MHKLIDQWKIFQSKIVLENWITLQLSKRG